MIPDTPILETRMRVVHSLPWPLRAARHRHPFFPLTGNSEDVETFEILTCRAVAMANDAGGVCEFVLRPLFSDSA